MHARGAMSMESTATLDGPPAMRLAKELGDGGQVLKRLLQTTPMSADDDELFHVRKIATQSPKAFEESTPALWKSTGVAAANLLWGATVTQDADVAYKKGLWRPPADTTVFGLGMCDVNSPLATPVPAALLASGTPDTEMTITLFCADVPLGSLEHELFDKRVKPTSLQRYILSPPGARDLHDVEHAHRTHDARDVLAHSGLSKFPHFLLGGDYHLCRNTVLPFLKLRRAQTEEEVTLLRKVLPPKLNAGPLKLNSDALANLPRATKEGQYKFQVVFQSSDIVHPPTDMRFDNLVRTPVLAPLVDFLLLKSLPAGASSNLDFTNDQMLFKGFIAGLSEREVEYANGKMGSTTRKYKDCDLATLGDLARVKMDAVAYGASARPRDAINHIFGETQASFLEGEFVRAGCETWEDDLRTIAKFLDPDELLLYTTLEGGLIASTTCCGNGVLGMKIKLDSLSRLCTFPWVVHLVQSHGGISRQVPASGEARRLMKLAPGIGAPAPPPVTPTLNVGQIDFDRLLAKMEEVKTLVTTKRKRDDGDGDGDGNGAACNGSIPADVRSEVCKMLASAQDASENAGKMSKLAATVSEHTSTLAENSIAAGKESQEVLQSVAAEAVQRLENAEKKLNDAVAAITNAAGRAAAAGELMRGVPTSTAAGSSNAASPPASAPAVAAPSPRPRPLPSGIAALGSSLVTMRETDKRLKRRMHALLTV
ncbi:MAG: hypothetical protein CL844_06465 [Crocinitomicaceae bacterium]|nr:hypothetical protein [Crocinitomicaceae bacterium]